MRKSVLLAIVLIAAGGIATEARAQDGISFLRGDANLDLEVNLTDAVYILNFLFTGGRTPGCMKAADVDDTGSVDLTDAVYLLNYLFIGGAAPAEPVACGLDPTGDNLSCETVPEACE